MNSKRRTGLSKWLLLFFALIFSFGSLFISYMENNVGFSAGTLNTGLTGLSASYDNGTRSINGTTISGSVKTTAKSGCTGTTYTQTTGTLTFTNTSDTEGLLTYSASILSGSGTLTDNNNGSVTLAAGGTASLSVTSAEGIEDTTEIEITNIGFTLKQDITVTCGSTEHGTWLINNNDAIEGDSYTQSNTVAFNLSANPDDGYKLLGWYDSLNDIYVGNKQNDSVFLTQNSVIQPVFVENSSPIFKTGDWYFTDLNEAVSYASNNNQNKVILIGDGELSAGNYNIVSGVTLLIPFDDGYTLYEDTPIVIYNSYTMPTPFRTLTMNSGSNITIQNGGAISCSGQLSSKGQMGGYNGTPTGPDGRIEMLQGSNITIKNGGKLYVWGYIFGKGTIIAESGSIVYEAFQIKDWRGGTATSNVYDYAFIFSQYYVQNIEVEVTVDAGASIKLYSAVNASSRAYTIGATLIGSGGLFNVLSGYLVKDYIENEDRLQIDIHGNAEVTPMSITGLPIIGSIGTDNYEMPITSNITINIHSGTTTIKQDIKLLPSCKVNIDSGATLDIYNGKKMFIYDNDDWGNFTGKARLYVIGYSVANGTTVKRNAAGLKDARINVDGTINVNSNSSLYTSTGKANICSDAKTGKIVFNSGQTNSETTISEMENNSDKKTVKFYPSILHNSNIELEYTETSGSASNTKFIYCSSHDIWYKDGTLRTVIFKSYDGNSILYSNNHCHDGLKPEYNAEEPSMEGYKFEGWSGNSGQSSGTQTSELSAIQGDKTYYAAFSKISSSIKITWKNYDGTTLYEGNVEEGKLPVFPGSTPTKPATDSESYVFDGWDPEVVVATEDAVYTAKFKSITRQYTLTLKYDLDDTKTKTISLDYNSNYQFVDYIQEFEMPLDYHIKEWRSNDVIKNVGDSISITTDLTFTAYTGGWVTLTGNYYFVPYEFTDKEYAKGLYYCEKGKYEAYDGKIHYFDETTGAWNVNYSGTYTSNGSTYYINSGIVDSSEGIKQINNNGVYTYCYVNENGVVVVSDSLTSLFFTENQVGSYLTEGNYKIDSNGIFVREDNTPTYSGNKTPYIKNDYVYIDGIRVAYGLILVDNYYYYATEDGSLAKNCSYYVARVNEYNQIIVGIYYFDAQGRMCDERMNVIRGN